MKIDEYMAMAEKRIFKKGSLISSWYASSKKEKIGEIRADLLVRGNMAVKGFLLSRAWSWTTPRWETLAVVFSNREGEKASPDQLKKLITETEKYMSKNYIKWSWLVYVSEVGFKDETVNFVKSRLKKEIGIMLVDLSSNSLACNHVLVNKYGTRVFKP
nr:hypothetical protein [Candidatus Njordarchaeota archaeon]